MEEVEGVIDDITFFVNGNKVDTSVSLQVVSVHSIHTDHFELP